MPDKFRKVCVIGVGLIGGSLALGMRQRGLAEEIIGVGRTLKNLKIALKLGVITHYTRKVETAVKNADLVIFAVPVRTIPELLKKARPNLLPGAIITDVASTKAKLIQTIEPIIPPGLDLVPAHPIAGREKSGAQYSDPELFKGRWTIITPAKSSSAKGIERIRELWLALGAKVQIMSPEIHDRILACVSHLPHLVAYSLVGTLLEMEKKTRMLCFSAGGFKDFTRIAESSPEMWRDICLENKQEILQALRTYEKQLNRIEGWLEKEQGTQLEKFFRQCKNVKEKIKTND